MKISPKQQEILNKKIQEIQIRCPICGNNNIAYSDKLFEIREFQEGRFVLGGKSGIIPMVVGACQNCAYMIFLNAIQLGLVIPELNQTDTNEKTKL